MDGTRRSGPTNKEVDREVGYIQNEEQSESTIWKRLKERNDVR